MNVDEYHKLAEVEDRMWYFRALHAHIQRKLVEALDDRPSDVLDAGCGTGGLMGRLRPQHPSWRWTGVDVSELACEFTRRRFDGPDRGGDSGSRTTAVEIRQGSVTSLPFRDQSFDAIVSADVLYHVSDDLKALQEFARVLRPRGLVVLNVPAYQWLWSYHDVAVHSHRRYTRGGLMRKLRAAGFGELYATYWNTLPFPLVAARRKLFPAPKGGSDVHLYPPILERGFDLAMALERGWLSRLGWLPFGVSVFAVARRP